MPSSTQFPSPTSPTTPAPPLAPSDDAPPRSASLIPRAGLRELALILVCVILCAPASAQRQQTTTSEQPTLPGVNTNTSTPDQNPALGRMAERMAIERNTDRQKQIVNDTARLLELAQELNTDVSKSDKDTLSVAVVKKAEEIES